MAKATELKKASESAYKLLALTKIAAYACDHLETNEVIALFDLAYDLSDKVTVFLLNQEAEIKANEK